MTVTRSVVVANQQGLHARPIQRIVEICRRYRATVRISRGSQSVDARSILEMLSMAAPRGTTLTISADGPEADGLVTELVALIEAKFGED